MTAEQTAQRVCPNCTKPLDPTKRRDSIYCSDACRYEAFVKRGKKNGARS